MTNITGYALCAVVSVDCGDAVMNRGAVICYDV